MGFDYRFEHYRDAQLLLEAQRGGSTQIFAGVATLPVLKGTNLFSDPVANTQVRLFVRADRAEDPVYINPRNKRIGIVPPGAGAEGSALLTQNRIVEFPDDSSLFVDLLRGGIDGALVPQERLLAKAHSIGLDHRIVPVGEVVQRFDRVVAVHESRAVLMPAINAAIRKLEASGELESLREKWFLDYEVSMQTALSVGVYHFPPYQVVEGDGGFSGFGVETLRDIAELAGLDLNFEEISLENWQAGPSLSRYDMLPQAGINAERRTRMDFTLSIEKAPFSIFMRNGEAGVVQDLDDLAGRKVGVQAANLARGIAEAQGALDLVYAENQNDLLESLLDGRAVAILYPTNNILELAASRGVTAKIEAIEPPFFISERAPALRRGLARQREKLNAVIPGYLISQDYTALQKEWFGMPVFWTRTRIYWLVGFTSAVFLGLSGLALWQRQQKQRLAFDTQARALELEQAHASAQARLVRELERSNRELDEFAYTASHDLKEPLRGIAINAEFLAREGVSEKGQERLKRMVLLTARMEKLISDLLFFSRLSRGEKTFREIDPVEIVEGIVADLDEWTAEQNGTISVVTDMPWLYAERPKIKTVFQNLIVNGLKYNDAVQRTVEIGYAETVDIGSDTLQNVFFVRDNGIGIEARNHDKIFRIFNRLNREEDFGAGTGAGLSFVRKIVEENGSEVRLESSLGAGSTFYFSLPLADPMKFVKAIS